MRGALAACAVAFAGALAGAAVLDCRVRAPRDWAVLVRLEAAAAIDLWNERGGVGVATISVPDGQVEAFRRAAARLKLECQPRHMPFSLTPLVAATRSDGHASFFDDYRSTAQIHAALHAIAQRSSAPGRAVHAEVASMGRSARGTPQLVLRLSSRRHDAKKTVYVGCLQHAREWVAAAACVHLAAFLSGGSRAALRVLSVADVHIAPVLNPDGYAHSRSTDRMWRKTVHNSGVRAAGADMNRNWPAAMWGGAGASRLPASEIYCGARPASEPEVSNAVAYLAHLNDGARPLALAVDVHSFGQLVLRPPGWTRAPLSDARAESRLSAAASAAAAAMSAARRQPHRAMRGGEMYPAAGSFEDWAWEALRVPALTLELRDTGRHGFLLPPAQIRAAAAELRAGVVAAVEYLLADGGE